MRKVMWNGELSGSIHLDTLSNKKNLYGLGPSAYLDGELLIVDGKSYKSSVVNSHTMEVKETFDVRAPFFVYAHIDHWKEELLPDTILTIQQLETYLDKKTQLANRPFAFKLKGVVEKATIHVLNLPEGSTVSSPDEAHQGLQKYALQNTPAEMVGIFSTTHKAVFTHHDSFVHIHLITIDRTEMGHLEEVYFKKGIKLFLPAE